MDVFFFFMFQQMQSMTQIHCSHLKFTRTHASNSVKNTRVPTHCITVGRSEMKRLHKAACGRRCVCVFFIFVEMRGTNTAFHWPWLVKDLPMGPNKSPTDLKVKGLWTAGGRTEAWKTAVTQPLVRKVLGPLLPYGLWLLLLKICDTSSLVWVFLVPCEARETV